MMVQRFTDRGERLYRFMDQFMVHCPRCDRRAQVVLLDDTGKLGPEAVEARERGFEIVFLPRRLVCGHCGYTRDWRGHEVHWAAAVDPYFHQTLWLQAPCCNETLWAYNERHLDFLEDYVKAGLREGRGHGSLASKLPRWLMSAGNRDAILQCIDKLRETLRP